MFYRYHLANLCRVYVRRTTTGAAEDVENKSNFVKKARETRIYARVGLSFRRAACASRDNSRDVRNEQAHDNGVQRV